MSVHPKTGWQPKQIKQPKPLKCAGLDTRFLTPELKATCPWMQGGR